MVRWKQLFQRKNPTTFNKLVELVEKEQKDDVDGYIGSRDTRCSFVEAVRGAPGD